MSHAGIPRSGATPGPGGSPLPDKKLDTWKEIADYLGRETRTVQRWEKTEGLPVHRHEHQKKSTVYAYAGELDAWFKKRQPVDDPEADAAFVPDPETVAANSTAGSVAPVAPSPDPAALAVPDEPPPVSPVEPPLPPPIGKRIAVASAAAAILCIAVYGAYHWFQVQALPQAKVRLV